MGKLRGTSLAEIGYAALLASESRVWMYDVKRQLFAEHQQLAFSSQYLARAARGGAKASLLRECWAHFESGLLEHLAAEERHLFGLVVEAHRAGVEALYAEHAQIRHALVELGRSVDLGEMDLEQLDVLRKLLAANSDHENCSLYQWLEESDRPGIHPAPKVLEARSKPNTSRERSVTAPAIPRLVRAAHSP